MMAQREIYEKRAEIMTKRLLSRIYALEAKALETRQDARKSMQKLNENVNWDETLNRLKEERENLNKRYQELTRASEKNWNEMYERFGEYTDRLNSLREDYTELSSDWLRILNDRISHLEKMANESGETIGDYFNKQVSTVRGQVNKLEDRWSGLQNQTTRQWKDFRHDVDEELNTIRTTISNLYSHFRKSGNQQEEHKKSQEE